MDRLLSHFSEAQCNMYTEQTDIENNLSLENSSSAQSTDVESDTASDDDESRSSSSGRLSPSSSLNRGLSTFARDMSSSLDHTKASSLLSTKKGYCVKQGAVVSFLWCVCLFIASNLYFFFFTAHIFLNNFCN